MDRELKQKIADAEIQLASKKNAINNAVHRAKKLESDIKATAQKLAERLRKLQGASSNLGSPLRSHKHKCFFLISEKEQKANAAKSTLDSINTQLNTLMDDILKTVQKIQTKSATSETC